MTAIQDSTLVDKKDNLVTFRRDDRVLIIDPDSASWIVLSGEFMPVFSKLRRGQPFSLLAREHPGLHPDGLRFFVDDLFKQGIVRLNGRYFFDNTTVWDDRGILPSLSIDMGTGCSLSCPGCIRGKFPPSGYGAKEILHAGWESTYSMIFTGGEPLLDPALPEILEELTGRIAYRVRIMIHTGGIPLEDDMLEKLAHFKTGLIFRLDGPREIHDRLRLLPGGGGSFDKTRDALLRARDKGLDVAVNSKIQSPEDLLPAVEYFVSEGLSQARISLQPPAEPREKIWEEWGRAQGSAAEYLREKNLADGTVFHLYDLKHIVRSLVARGRVSPCHFSPCMAGTRVHFLGPEGIVGPCKELSQAGAPAEKAELASRTVDALPKCRRCAFRNFCGGGCPARAYSAFGTIMREDPACPAYRYLIPELMWRLHEDPGLPAALGVNIS